MHIASPLPRLYWNQIFYLLFTLEIYTSNFCNKKETKDSTALVQNTSTEQEILFQLRLLLPSDASSPQLHPPCCQLMLSEMEKTEIKWEQKQVAFRKLINYCLRQRQEERREEFERLCQGLSFIIHYKKMNGGSLWSTWEWGDWLVPKKNKKSKPYQV